MNLKLPKYIAEDCVIQRGNSTNIWGIALPNTQVDVDFQGRHYSCVSEGNGEFLFKVAASPGINFPLVIKNMEDEIKLNVNVGDVFICSGQSNMELPISRVREKYPLELGNPFIKEFKVFENLSLEGNISKDFICASWRSCINKDFEDVSAFGYFYAQYMFTKQNIPIGFVNISKGGSPIESFMQEKYIHNPKSLELLYKFKDPEYFNDFFSNQKKIQFDRQKALDYSEKAFLKKYNIKEINMISKKLLFNNSIELPNFFKDTKIGNFCGLIYLKKKFLISSEDYNLIQSSTRNAILYLGTIADFDKVYVNGRFVGSTEYKYPPRKYQINKNLLHAGENEILIRLVCNNFEGRFTPHKKYEIYFDDIQKKYDLTGIWNYEIIVEDTGCEAIFFPNNIPTSIFYGMLTPAFYISNAGVIWYQGESNDSNPYEYEELLKNLIMNWREHWKILHLHFSIIGLPKCKIDIYGTNNWNIIRQAQRAATNLPNVLYIDNIDLGEENDLHPLDKQDMAYRAASVRLLSKKETAYEKV